MTYKLLVCMLFLNISSFHNAFSMDSKNFQGSDDIKNVDKVTFSRFCDEMRQQYPKHPKLKIILNYCLPIELLYDDRQEVLSICLTFFVIILHTH